MENNLKVMVISGSPDSSQWAKTVFHGILPKGTIYATWNSSMAGLRSDRIIILDWESKARAMGEWSDDLNEISADGDFRRALEILKTRLAPGDRIIYLNT